MNILMSSCERYGLFALHIYGYTSAKCVRGKKIIKKIKKCFLKK